MRVGVVGCGVISRHYAEKAREFESFDLVACADVMREAAEALAGEFALAAATVDELLADPSVDIVLNLTTPVAHAEVTRAALAAGKHVYSEKPLGTSAAEAAELLAEAARRGLRLGCAPDIFLGGAYQAARALVDDGAIGTPLAAGAEMVAGGFERWHPNPDIFVAEGAGPLLDMGPYYLTAFVALLGPITRVAGFASTRVRERDIRIGPRAGERFTAATPTHTTATLELEGGVTATLVASFEAPGHYVSQLALYGSEAVLALPDPNHFGGVVRLKRGREWEEVPYTDRGAREARGLGLHDLVEAIAAERAHRASAELGLHVVDAGRSILRAAAEGRTVELETRPDRPEPMPVAHSG
jgi:predicted dehydrogenase